MEDDDGFTFGEFVFAPPLPNTQLSHPLRNRVDPKPADFGIRKGALPLSLFGEVDAEIGDLNHGNHVESTGKFGDDNPNIKSVNGSVLNYSDHNVGGNDGDDDDDDDDDDDFGEWEFKGALFPNNGVIQGSDQDQRAEVVKVVEITPKNKDTSNSVEHKPEISSFSLDFNDLFAALPGAHNKSTEKEDGYTSTPALSNGFSWDAFSGAENNISNGSGVFVMDYTGKPNSSSALSQSTDIFAGSPRAGNRLSDSNVAPKSTSVTIDGFEWGAFGGSRNVSNGREISDAATISVEHNPRSNSFFPPSNDLFAAPIKADNKAGESDFEFKSTDADTYGFSFAAFPEVGMTGNRSGPSATSSSPVEQKPVSGNFFFPSDNLFVVPEGIASKSSETFGEFKATSLTTNGFMFHAFPEAEVDSNRNILSSAAATTANEDDNLDDFGDFVDASQEIRKDEQELVLFPHMTVAAEKPLENGKSQDKRIPSFNAREPLPLFLFGDSTEETSDTLNQSDELFPKHTSQPGKVSMVSIHDLLSNMYSQAQNIPSVESGGNPAKTSAHNSQEKESPPVGGDDEWDENSWEFKSAFREAGVNDTPSSAIPGNVAQLQLETSQNIQDYIDFYMELRNMLCYLLSCQLNELEGARSPDGGTGSAEIMKMHDNEIQKARKLLEETVASQVVSKKHFEKSNCLSEVFRLMEEPKFKIIESEFSLSKHLQLADSDWRVTSDLLRNAISILKILSLCSADEQSRYVSTWCNVVNVCARELRHSTLILKQASEKRVRKQVLSDSRGQKHIQALGEIYKVVELLGLSTKVYKAWMLFSVSDSSRFTDLLNECRALWSNSGLEEALQSLSDDIGFGRGETSIKNIRDFDVLAIHDCVLGQPKSICRISLLPQELLPDLKTVSWNGEPYFLSLANLWANLISSDPPQLPQVQVNQTDR